MLMSVVGRFGLLRTVALRHPTWDSRADTSVHSLISRKKKTSMKRRGSMPAGDSPQKSKWQGYISLVRYLCILFKAGMNDATILESLRTKMLPMSSRAKEFGI